MGRGIACNFGNKPMILVNDVKLLEEFYTKKLTKYHIMDEITEVCAPLSGLNLMSSKGDDYKKIRPILAHAFNFNNIKEALPKVVSIIDGNLEMLEDKSEVRISDFFSKNVGEIFLATFFGKSILKETYKGRSYPEYLFKLVERLGFISFNPIKLFKFYYWQDAEIKQLLQDCQDYRENILGKINEIKKKVKEGRDLENSLIEQMVMNKTLNEQEILNNYITLFIAGVDATANWMAHCFYYLEKNPETKRKLYEEIDREFDSDDNIENFEYDKVSKNNPPYLTAVMKETMRFSSSSPGLFPREANCDHMLGDLKIKKGTVFGLTFICNMLDSQYFKNPEKFMPERWADDPKFESTLNPFAFIPFSAGPRNCLGQHMAKLEGKVLVASFMKKYNFKVKNIDSVEWTFALGYQTKEPLTLEITKR